MPLTRNIEESFKSALKAQDKLKTSVLRLLRSAIKNREVELRRSLDEPEIIQTIRGMIRQRKESIEQFEKGGRQDLADKEKAEIEILSSYLPSQAAPSEIEEVIEQAVKEVNASGMKDMGKVMKQVMARLAGRAEGQLIQTKVKERLSSGQD